MPHLHWQITFSWFPSLNSLSSRDFFCWKCFIFSKMRTDKKEALSRFTTLLKVAEAPVPATCDPWGVTLVRSRASVRKLSPPHSHGDRSPLLGLGTCCFFLFQDLAADLATIPKKSFRISSDLYQRPSVISQRGRASFLQITLTQSRNHCQHLTAAAMPCSCGTSSRSLGCLLPCIVPLVFPSQLLLETW